MSPARTEHGRLHIAVAAEMVLGSPFAHAINTFKTAGGFARLGHRVTVFCLPPTDGCTDAALAAYGEPSLEIHAIAPETSSDADAAARSFAIRAAGFALALGCNMVYARNFHIAFEAPRLGLPTVIETHAHAGDLRPILDALFAATRHPAHPIDAIATIAPVLRDHYIARGADPARVHIVPDAADPDLFARPPGWSPRADRARPLALYAGHLYDYKGIPTILAAAAVAPEIDWALLGGTDDDVRRVRASAALIPNVRILGRVPHADAPRHLWDADVLVLPPSAGHPSAAWTSPVKLAEYLWADRPIVASRIPGLVNWIDEPAVAWCTPDDPRALAASVRAILTEPLEASHRRAVARAAAAARFTYANRASAMLEAARSLPARSRASA